jgi:hypothetical protein
MLEHKISGSLGLGNERRDQIVQFINQNKKVIRENSTIVGYFDFLRSNYSFKPQATAFGAKRGLYKSKFLIKVKDRKYTEKIVTSVSFNPFKEFLMEKS